MINPIESMKSNGLGIITHHVYSNTIIKILIKVGISKYMIPLILLFV
jgi:hypothetical protein